jgi:hypothetical protein
MRTDTHVEIKVNGKSVKQYSHNGAMYIEARSGTEYSISVNNDGWNRKLAVITVDGLNVITGQPQEDDVGQGYIINSRSSINIKGFRQDKDTVGAFKFCKKSGAYCNEQGLKGNNGVIGVRVYDEVVQTVMYNTPTFTTGDFWCTTHPNSSSGTHYRSLSLSDTSLNNTAGVSNDIKCCYTASVAEAPKFELGTTWGQKINDSIKYTEFEVDKNSSLTSVIYYDSRENLEKIGINFTEEKQVFFPKAFGGFATPPKGWKGK